MGKKETRKTKKQPIIIIQAGGDVLELTQGYW